LYIIIYKEKINFYFIAKGSLTELQNQLIIVKDVNLLDKTIFQKIYLQSTKTSKLINGLIKYCRK